MDGCVNFWKVSASSLATYIREKIEGNIMIYENIDGRLLKYMNRKT